MTVRDHSATRQARVGSLLARVRRAVGRFAQNRRGNVLMITGLSIVPLSFATGMGIDYSRAMRVQTKLNGISDAAALAAVTQPMMGKLIPTACDVAMRTFVTQATGLDGVVLDMTNTQKLKIVVTDTYANGTPVTVTCPSSGSVLNPPATLPIARSATVTYNGLSSNSFAKILGVETLTIKGTASARATLAPYINVHLALDTSQSMGLPSTDEGAQALWKKTGELNGRSCQFGCHEVGVVDNKPEKYANEAIAKLWKIPLRVNVEAQAVSDMVDTAKANQGAQSLYQFGVYQFGITLSDLIKLTPDLTSVKTAVSDLTLGPNDGKIGYGDTNLTDVFNAMKSRITVRGDGSTQDQARAFLFIITDGVQDLCGSSHCTAMVDPTMCDYYKNNNITLGIVYTTYLPVKADPTDSKNTNLRGEYNNWIARLPPEQIAPKLRACASPGWFFEASDGDGIHAAMQRLFGQASQTASIIH